MWRTGHWQQQTRKVGHLLINLARNGGLHMDLTIIGQRIKSARESAQITQEELGRAVGCTAKHIGAIERGIKTPRLDTFISIANITGVSSDCLLQDCLDKPGELVAGEFSAVIAQLSPETQKRVLRALRAFVEENE